jgi:hypothetical protein
VLRNNPHVVGTNEKPKNLSPNALHVSIFREMFADFFELTLDNGHTEELEPDDTREWFRLRGASMDAVEKALDHAWNFRKAEFYIQTPREPLVNRPQYAPKL